MYSFLPLFFSYLLPPFSLLFFSSLFWFSLFRLTSAAMAETFPRTQAGNFFN